MKDYKIETKPTFWHVTLESGAYSDWNIKNLFFRGNDEMEVWDMLCRYITDTYDTNDYSSVDALSWEDREMKYAVPAFIEKQKEWRGEEETIDWSTDYGDAKLVKINRLKVIEFHK